MLQTLVFSIKISTPLQTGTTSGKSLSNVSYLDSVLYSLHTMYQSNYAINHQQLLPRDAHTDLGIVMSADLSWCKHYDLISSRVYRTRGLLHRTFNTTNSVHVKKLEQVSHEVPFCSHGCTLFL